MRETMMTKERCLYTCIRHQARQARKIGDRRRLRGVMLCSRLIT